MSKGSAIVLALILGVAGFAIGKGMGGGGGDETAEADAEATAADTGDGAQDDVERFKIPVTKDQPSKGPDDALVTIVEFSEFQCPFCNRVEPTLKSIREEYGDKVRFVWRNQPLGFHQNADPAAQVAMEAFKQGGNEKFWELHDILFANQKTLERANLEKYAAQAGLDMAGVKAALDNKTHQKTIAGDQAVASTFGVRGTPNFFINGRNLRGAQPLPAFKAIIDDEIKRAEALVKAGTKKEQVYAALTKNALTKAVPPKPRPQPGQPDPATVYKVPLQGDEPQAGPKDALVTIVQYSDFECPFCGRVEPTITEIKKKYGKDVRVVWMNNPLPFHKSAMPAAIAALEAQEQKGDKGFWEMHEKLFANQRGLTRENLEKFGKEIGLNVGKLKKALDSNKFESRIKKEQALAATLGARGTPSFFINGRNLRGAQPIAAFTALIDEELAKAKKLVSAGTSRDKVYDEVIKNGATKVAAAPAAPEPKPDTTVYKVQTTGDRPYKGNPNAKVVIQEFSDFQCPFCSRVNPSIAEIVKNYGDKVKIEWGNYPLPFHKDAHPAAQAAREVFEQGGNKKFWAYHDKLFANQRALSVADLEKYAQEIGGINMSKFKAALEKGTHKAAIDADMAAVTKAGARIGTPSFFINGRLLQGAQPYESFKNAIERALKE